MKTEERRWLEEQVSDIADNALPGLEAEAVLLWEDHVFVPPWYSDEHYRLLIALVEAKCKNNVES